MKSCLRLFASDKIIIVGITSHPVITHVQSPGLQDMIFSYTCSFKCTVLPRAKCWPLISMLLLMSEEEVAALHFHHATHYACVFYVQGCNCPSWDELTSDFLVRSFSLVLNHVNSSCLEFLCSVWLKKCKHSVLHLVRNSCLFPLASLFHISPCLWH